MAAEPLLDGTFFPCRAMSPQPGTDAELVGRSRAGDLTAFEQLYRKHVPRVFGLCLRMVADRARAEDLAQEAFVRAWRKLASFRGHSAFGTWLYRLTVNVVLSELRLDERREQPLEPASLDSLAGGQSLPVQDIDLERAIASLPRQARLVFVLHDVEGYRHREIAAMTGLAEGTSKAHLHRARKLLREALRR